MQLVLKKDYFYLYKDHIVTIDDLERKFEKHNNKKLWCLLPEIIMTGNKEVDA